VFIFAHEKLDPFCICFSIFLYDLDKILISTGRSQEFKLGRWDYISERGPRGCPYAPDGYRGFPLEGPEFKTCFRKKSSFSQLFWHFKRTKLIK
jgi:hypothetical protein